MGISASYVVKVLVSHASYATSTTLKPFSETRLNHLAPSGSAEFNSSKFQIFLVVAVYLSLKFIAVVDLIFANNLCTQQINFTV